MTAVAQLYRRDVPDLAGGPTDCGLLALVRSPPHRNVTEIAREPGVSPEGVRGWVKQDRTGRGEGRPGDLTSPEREELARLRRQNLEQQKTIEILRKAAAYFAAETNR